MPDDIRAKGYISVYLVMDMKPFVHPDDRQRFETVRGFRAFAEVLHNQWPHRMQNSAFHVVDEDLMAMGQSPVMSTDEVGFVTGIFRSNMLDLYSSPLYRVNKDEFQFSEPVASNLQFDKLFKPIWDNWEICLRPTMTGMLVVRLTRPYDKPIALLTQASDVIELQQPFDVPSAIKALNKLQADITSPGHTTEERTIIKHKMESTQAFLEWLGVHNHDAPELDYIPVQWQLASEIGQQFIRDVGSEIHLPDGKIIKLHSSKPDLSTTLYDSYTVYHFDQLVADPAMIIKAPKHPQTGDEADEGESVKRTPQRNLVTVQPSDVKRSIRVQWCLVGMVEGAILSKSATSGSSNRRFPRHNLGVVKRIFEQDIATWADELCVLTSRTAIIMPSYRSQREHLFVSKLDAKTTTTYVEYTRYWEALERLIEFVLEINMLAQLVEHSSASTLQQFVTELHRARRNILHGDLNGPLKDSQRHLMELTNASANLSRLVGVCQGLINPNFWSRAEYAVEKASHLIRQMEVSLLLGHAERNVNNLTDLVDHVDEIYLAQLSERSNEQNSRQSIILAGLSLSIILFTLPSFWADISQLNNLNSVIDFVRDTTLLGMLALLGSLLAPVIFVGSIVMALWVALPGRFKSWRRKPKPSL